MSLSDFQTNILKARLTRTEGRRNRPYIDTVGKVTIGIGHNLTDKGVPDTLVEEWFTQDITEAATGAEVLPAYNYLDPIRQTVLIDMIFNMGLDSVKEFVNTLALLKRGDYVAASEQMLKSKWATQVGNRAIELAEIIRTGEIRGI